MQDDKLIITNLNLDFPHQSNPMSWQGNLTDLQQKIALEVIQSYQNKCDHLVWSVTGAGKTEITFPLLERIISNNQRVAICSPRIDVCIELYPRIQAAFNNASVGLFHGKSDIQYYPTQIMISTVHQLVKFHKAFDVIIVDEVDSYPLAGNEMLEGSIAKAKKVSGSIVYLSATPPAELLDEVSNGKINISKLYRRFHNHPLPEPICHCLLKPTTYFGINPRLRIKMSKLVNSQQRFIVFFPRIPDMLYFEKIIKKFFPKLKLVSVSSKDSKRIEKVQQFRDEQADVILTTTILERGVTFHNITVLVLDADADEFSKTALIQIAGRAGRSQDSPNDEVHLYYQFYNKKIKSACSEIKQVNRQAYKK
ncbi:DEAD/DEAH box helicase [Companilactobacillus ginsenosidimutans]|uniref:DEAD/DEAH box helicase n=1 Tax=Companilactobacillus ginsenosidimutans TaxID=1007676 RepID=UPI0018DD6BFF|nr:DEAD/DEAH box helicase [Companilactobacillus ginsenosidimutans]